MLKKKEFLPLLMISAVIVFLLIGSFIKKDVYFSSNENRYLQQTPKCNFTTIFNGDFEEDAEEYMSDQIILRDLWMGAKSTMQKLVGKTDINGAYLGKDGYYFEKVTEDTFPQETFEKNVDYVKQFMDKNEDKDCRILIAPSPMTILSEKLPKNATPYEATVRFDTLKDTFEGFVDIRDEISQVEYSYYRTDHHWTSEGAYAAYTAWCKAKGIEIENYPLTQVSDSFYGTMYSKVLLPNSVPDSVDATIDISIQEMECDGEVYDSFYFEEKLKEKNHYEYFMGGNYAKAVITTGASTGKSLLLIKDSFANSFLPFILNQYDTITLLDLRYYNKSIEELTQENADILVLYELTNFAKDSNLVKLIVK